MDTSLPFSQPRKAALAVSMTWVAGFVDALGYMTLYHVYTANMSGNTIAVGIRAAERNWPRALHRALPILAFFIGLLVSGIVLEWLRRRGLKRALSVTLGLEAALLLGLLVGGCMWARGQHHKVQPGRPATLMVLVAGMAMGIQNGSVTRVGALSIHTTHVTGSLTALAGEVAAWLFWVRDHWVQERMRAVPLSLRQRAAQQMLLLTLLWIVYLIGALLAIIGLEHWGFLSVGVPLLLLMGNVASDLWRPMPVKAPHERLPLEDQPSS